MANIDTYLAAIRNAIYGEQVRTAICDAISAINTEVTTWTGLQLGAKLYCDSRIKVGHLGTYCYGEEDFEGGL